MDLPGTSSKLGQIKQQEPGSLVRSLYLPLSSCFDLIMHTIGHHFQESNVHHSSSSFFFNNLSKVMT